MREETITAEAGSKTYDIKPANWRDLNELRTLEAICFPIDQWSLIDMIAILSMHKVVRFKATLAGKMIGFIAGEIKSGNQPGWIATLAVLPAYRRLGIASSLLDRCETGLGKSAVRLCVRKHNTPAINLYKQRGYHYIESWAHYYIDGEDAIILEKKMEG